MSNPQGLILSQEEYDSLNETTVPLPPEPKPSTFEEELRQLSDNELLDTASEVTKQKVVDITRTESLIAELRGRRYIKRIHSKGVSRYTKLVNNLERLIAKSQRTTIRGNP